MKQQNFFHNISKIKETESDPKIVKLFNEKEIKDILEFYQKIPISTFNEKQKIKKKHWHLEVDKKMDDFIKNKIDQILNDWEIDNMYSDQPAFGLFHETFGSLGIHADTGHNSSNVIYKQVLIPLTDVGETILYEPRWYGQSSSFTLDKEELKNANGYNKRTNEHIGEEDFDKELYNKYLTYEDYSNLKGLKVKTIYEWKLGDAFIFDRTFIHSSSILKKKKIALTIFFNRKIS